MGQYYVVANLDKNEFLDPHHCGDGAKLIEFSCGGWTMTCLAVLLATFNGQGGGDLFFDKDTPKFLQEIPGRWAGDRIAVVGDYDEKEIIPAQPKLKGITGRELYAICSGSRARYPGGPAGWSDISFAAIRTICEDKWAANKWAEDDGEGNGWAASIWQQEGEKLPRKVVLLQRKE